MLNWIEIRDRIFEVYKISKQKELADALNIDKTVVSRWMAKKESERRIPTMEILAKVVQDKGVTWDWLLTGGKVLRNKDVPAKKISHIINGKEYRSYPTPVYSSSVADSQHDSAAPRVVATNAIQEGYFALPNGSAGIKIIGNSMEPLARNGQVAIMAPEGRSPINGDLVVVTLTDDAGIYFKRYYAVKSKIKGMPTLVNLVSVNPLLDIAPMTIPETDIFDLRIVIAIGFEIEEIIE